MENNGEGKSKKRLLDGLSVDILWKVISSMAWLVVAVISFFIAPYLKKIDIAYDKVQKNEINIQHLLNKDAEGERWTEQDHQHFVRNNLRINYATKYWVRSNFVEK